MPKNDIKPFANKIIYHQKYDGQSPKWELFLTLIDDKTKHDSNYGCSIFFGIRVHKKHKKHP